MMFREETSQYINLPANSVYRYLTYTVNEELI